jgi:UDP-2,4-diacetamido-2,4,6-trideoxy-beta-L-altropyranose hydrolase
VNSGAGGWAPQLAVRCDGDAAVGLGHVKRCLALLDWVPKQNRCGIFLRHSSAAAERMLQDAGCGVFRIDGPCDDDAAKVAATGAEWVAMDVVHAHTRRRPDDLSRELAALRDAGLRILFFDGIGADALLAGAAEATVDRLVRPYVNVEPRNGTRLLGPEYFILSEPMAALLAAPRGIAKDGGRVLVTTGGADVGAVSPRIITALESIHGVRLDVRVAVGPAVPAEVRSATAAAAAKSRHRVELLEDCNDLTEHMLWCDVAVATTGLTKYELAATGTPAILISPDARHDELNRPFAGLACAADLGQIQSLSDVRIADSVRDLLADQGARETMSGAGRRLVDGSGAERILQTMRRISDVG